MEILKTLHIHVLRMTDLGCQRRGLDARRLMNYFRENNCELVDHPSKADYIIFITCAFRQEKEDECFQMLHKLKKYKAELIVMGCLPGIAPERLKSEFNGVAIPTSEMEKIDEFFPSFSTPFAEIPDANMPNRSNLVRKPALTKFFSEFEFSREFYKKVMHHVKPGVDDDKVRKAFLRISNGCLGNCSYCAIRYGTGRLSSKPEEDIIREYNRLIENGQKNIVITAEDTGAYGLDIQSDFPTLLQKILAQEAPEDLSLRIVAFQPRWAIKYKNELKEILKDQRIRIFYCPIQSGSNRIWN
jgi:threonylcarbamoyladenosine tRNA methylthiotransferase CDKAL1